MKTTYIFATAIAFALFTSCSEDVAPENCVPQFSEGDCRVDELTRKEATLFGAFATRGTSSDFGFMVSESPSLADAKTYSCTTESNSFSTHLENLQPGRTYYFCTYAKSGVTTVKGNTLNFTTPKISAPTFNKTNGTTVSDVNYTFCGVDATISDNGGTDIFLSGYIYKEVNEGQQEDIDLTYTSPNISRTVSEEAGVFADKLSNLIPGHTYAVRPYAVSSGIGYGAITVFTTPATQAPAPSTTTLNGVTKTSIDVTAEILSQGTSTVTECGFCYSDLTDEPTINNSHIKTASKNGNIMSATIAGLSDKTTYYVRAYAKNSTSDEVGYGEVMTVNISEELKGDEPVTVCTPLPVVIDDIEYGSLNDESFQLTASIDFQKYVNSYYDAYGEPSEEEGNYAERFPIIMAGFIYSTVNPEPNILEQKYDKMIVVKNPFTASDNKFSTTVSLVHAVTTYYVRAFAVNAFGTTYSPVKVIKVGPENPDNPFPGIF